MSEQVRLLLNPFKTHVVDLKIQYFNHNTPENFAAHAKNQLIFHTRSVQLLGLVADDLKLEGICERIDFKTQLSLLFLKHLSPVTDEVTLLLVGI